MEVLLSYFFRLRRTASGRSQIRNTKLEILNKFKSRNLNVSNLTNRPMPTRTVLFRAFDVGILGLFRISYFEFRISKMHAWCVLLVFHRPLA